MDCAKIPEPPQDGKAYVLVCYSDKKRWMPIARATLNDSPVSLLAIDTSDLDDVPPNEACPIYRLWDRPS